MRYVCERDKEGNPTRWCETEELDILEAVRTGEKKVVGASEKDAMPSFDTKPLEERLSSLEQTIVSKGELETKYKEVEAELGKERSEVWIDRFFDNSGVVDKHLEECPTCKAKDEARFISQAEKRGYAPKSEDKPEEPVEEKTEEEPHFGWMKK